MHNFEQQLAFIRELDRLKSVYRQALVKSDNNRQENSAEHSWHLCLIAQVLEEYAETEIQVDHVIRMLLVHDIVEIDAGDTFAFADSTQLNQQLGKELKAVERIFGLLPKQQCEEMTALWLEFERGESADAQFAKAIDRVVPVFMNLANDGGGWRRHKLTRTQLIKRNDFMRISMPRLWSYVVSQIDSAVERGWLGAE